jgi:hypothetical protein
MFNSRDEERGDKPRDVELLSLKKSMVELEDITYTYIQLRDVNPSVRHLRGAHHTT